MKKSILFVIAVILLLSSCKPTANAANTNETQEYSKAENETASVEKSPIVTFVELGSTTCIPCKQMQPIMKEIETEFPADVKVVFYDINVPSEKEKAMNYGIRVIPTQVFLDKDGNEFYRHEGFFPKEELVKILKEKGAEK